MARIGFGNPGLMGMLDGRCALITGASGGIGRVTAIEFAREGARSVGLHYATNRVAAECPTKEVKKLGARAVLLQADVSRRDQAKRMVEAFVKGAGRIDTLVCCAGYPFRREDWFANFEDLGEEAFLHPFRIDLLGSFFAAQAAAAEMKRQRSGSIVFVGSTPAITGDTVGLSYYVSKAGVLALTKGLAQILGPFNIHVNAVALGAVDTEAMSVLNEKERKALADEAALRRTGDPVEIARKIVFLCSDDASFLTGHTLVVDGGYAMR